MKLRKKSAIEKIFLVVVGMAFALLSSCQDYMPKPKGYFRIEPAPAIYTKLPVESVPYSFECPESVFVDSVANHEYGALILSYPDLNASLYCGYVSRRTRALLETSLEEVRSFLLKQQNVVSIEERKYGNDDFHLYGSLYILKGNCVSPIQFVLTDSITQLFRGALYYNFQPVEDSIAPVTEYLLKDIVRIIETFQWKKLNE